MLIGKDFFDYLEVEFYISRPCVGKRKSCFPQATTEKNEGAQRADSKILDGTQSSGQESRGPW